MTTDTVAAIIEVELRCGDYAERTFAEIAKKIAAELKRRDLLKGPEIMTTDTVKCCLYKLEEECFRRYRPVLDNGKRRVRK